MPRAQDRRVLKTKAQLRKGPHGPAGKKPLQEITVKELCEACDINRGNFTCIIRMCAPCWTK